MLKRFLNKFKSKNSGPIVLISANDQDLLKFAKYWAKKYSTKVFKFEDKQETPGAKKLQDFSFAALEPNQKTVTFYGHGLKDSFGSQNFDAKSFVDELIKRGLPKETELTLELLGCQIGHTVNFDSLLIRIATELYSREENGRHPYGQIKISGLNSLGADFQLQEFRLESVLTGFTKSSNFNLVGVPLINREPFISTLQRRTGDLENKIAINDAIVDQLMTIKMSTEARLKNDAEFLVRIEKYIKYKAEEEKKSVSFQTSLNQKTANQLFQDIKKKYDSLAPHEQSKFLQSQIDLFEFKSNQLNGEKISIENEIFREYSEVLSSTGDFRATLSGNKNFQITAASLHMLKNLSPKITMK